MLRLLVYKSDPLPQKNGSQSVNHQFIILTNIAWIPGKKFQSSLWQPVHGHLDSTWFSWGMCAIHILSLNIFNIWYWWMQLPLKYRVWGCIDTLYDTYIYIYIFFFLHMHFAAEWACILFKMHLCSAEEHPTIVFETLCRDELLLLLCANPRSPSDQPSSQKELALKSFRETSTSPACFYQLTLAPFWWSVDQLASLCRYPYNLRLKP